MGEMSVDDVGMIILAIVVLSIIGGIIAGWRRR